MTSPAFLDTNVLLRHILQDEPDYSARASHLLRSIRAGEVRVHTSQTVIFEAVYVLGKQFRAPKDRIAAILLEIVSYPSLVIPNRASVLAALAFWTQHGGLSFADCFHLALANHWGLERIYTFDQKMDRYTGVERIEP
jgi:predicted nucleic acid-binding protein